MTGIHTNSSVQVSSFPSHPVWNVAYSAFAPPTNDLLPATTFADQRVEDGVGEPIIRRAVWIITFLLPSSHETTTERASRLHS